MTNSNSTERLFSEGVFIALLTLLSYAAAYCFEWGYAVYFKLPNELIKVSLDLCLRAGVGIVAFFGLIICFGSFILAPLGKALKKSDTLWNRLVVVFAVLLVTYFTVDVAVGLPRWAFPIFLLVTAVLVMALLIIPGLVNRSRSTDKKPLIEHIRAAINRPKPFDLYLLLERSIGTRNYWLSHFALAALFSPFSLATHQLENRSPF